MNRHYEYIDSTGYHCGAAQEIADLPRENQDANIRAGNRILANLARAKGWLPFPGEIVDGQPVYIHIWHPNFPASGRMKRINLVQSKNGNPPLYDADHIKNADNPGKSILIAQHDKDGNAIPSMVINPIGKTSVPQIDFENAGTISTKTIVIQDMGQAPAEGSASAASTDAAPIVIPEPVPGSPIERPAPIETR